MQYASKKESQQREIEELRSELEKKTNDHSKLSTAMNDLKSANDQLQVTKIVSYAYIISNNPYRLPFLSNHSENPLIFLKRKRILNV